MFAALAPRVRLTMTRALHDGSTARDKAIPLVFAMVLDPAEAISKQWRRSGSSSARSGKWLGLLKQIAPGVTRPPRWCARARWPIANHRHGCRFLKISSAF
jgi:hypothetical protein